MLHHFHIDTELNCQQQLQQDKSKHRDFEFLAAVFQKSSCVFPFQKIELPLFLKKYFKLFFCHSSKVANVIRDDLSKFFF